MAITSTGYDGSITETQWANLVPRVGSSHYGVGGPGDWKVNFHPSLDRGVNISVGVGWGQGVMDTSDTVVALQGGTISSGTRWDLVVARRNWSGTGGATTFVMIPGSSARALPSRNTTPGSLDDQPIALVQFQQGNSAATQIVDLRCWGGNGGVVARDLLSLSYLVKLGAQVKIDGTLWSCVPDITGSPVWAPAVADGAISLFGTGNMLFGGVNPTTNFLVQAGTQANITDVSGYGRITFPKPFPNGVVTVMLTNGDSSVDRSRGLTLTPSVAGIPWNTGTNVDFVYALMASNNTVVGSALHRVNWIAIGW